MEGAEAEHAARRRLITRVLRDLHACLEVSAKAAGCAEQHISPMLMLHRKNAVPLLAVVGCFAAPLAGVA